MFTSLSGSAAGASTAPGTIDLVSQTAVVTSSAGTRLELSVQTPLPAKELSIQITLWSDAIDRSDFECALKGANLQDCGFSVLDLVPTIPITAKGVQRANGTLSLDLPVDAPGLGTVPKAPSNGAVLTFPSQSSPGVYPLEIGLEDSSTLTTLDAFTTFVVVAPSRAARPMHFAMVIPIGSSPATTSSGEPDPSAKVEDEIEELATALSAQPSVSVSLELYPQLVSALVAASSVAPHATAKQVATARAAQAALAALHHLDALSNVEITTETFTPMDVAAAAQAGLGSEVTEQLAAAGRALGAAKLTAEPHVYAASAPLGDDGSRLLAASGVDDLVVPSSSVVPVSPSVWGFPIWAPFVVQGTKLTADASDPYLEADLESGSDPALRASQLASDLADLYFAEQNDPPRGVTLLAPLGWQPTAAFLHTLLGALASNPVVASDTLKQFFDAVPPGSGETRALLVRNLTAGTVPAGDFPSAAELAGAQRALRALEALVPTEPALAVSIEERIWLSESTGLERPGRESYLAPGPDAIDAESAHLSLPTDRTITMTSLSAKIPISISSTSRAPLRVDLIVSSPGDELSFERTVFPMTLRPSNNTIEIRVKARSAGDFRLALRVRTTEEDYTLARGELVIRSTAISGVAVGLTVGAAAFLVIWWARSAFRRRRKGRHLRQRRGAPAQT